MPEHDTERRRELSRRQTSGVPGRRSANPVLVLQRSIGNRAVAQVLARDTVRTGTVQIAGVGTIKVKGGNLDAWAGKGSPDTVDVTSDKGRHSIKLEQLANAHTRTDIKVTIAAPNQAGEELSVGGGTLLEIKDARIKGYTVADGVETWRVTDFTDVHRTKVTHRVS